jgi:hypothetical protein
VHSMSSFAAKGVLICFVLSLTTTDSYSIDNTSVTDRYLAQLAGEDEYLIYVRWRPLAMDDRISDPKHQATRLQLQPTIDMQSHQH